MSAMTDSEKLELEARHIANGAKQAAIPVEAPLATTTTIDTGTGVSETVRADGQIVESGPQASHLSATFANNPATVGSDSK